MAKNDEAFEVVYDEAKRAIEDQQRVIGGLHARTGIVASAAALVLSLVAQRAGAERPSSYLLLAFLAYVGVGFLSAFILWPRRKWRLHFQPSRLLWHAVEGPRRLPASLIKRDLALYLEKYWEANGRKIDQLSWALAVALICLLIEALLLIYDVWRG